MAVMASDTPAVPPALPEKAQQLPDTSQLSEKTQLNGNTNHHDALFDASAAQNGMSNGTSENSTSQESAGATKVVVAAEDTSTAPVEHVEAGMSGVADFVPASATDSTVPATDMLSTTTEPPAVAASTSDVRDEPLPTDMSKPAAEAAPAATGQPEALVNTKPAAPQQEATEAPVEDKMDTSEDAPAASESHVSTDAVRLAERPDEPMESVEPAATPNVSAVVSTLPVPGQEAKTQTQTQQEQATAGQVRPREEDEEAEPVAKRAKTEGTEEGAAATDSAQPAAPTGAAASAPEQTNASAADAEASTSVPAAIPAPKQPPLDSNPITPTQTKFLLEQIRKAKKTKSALAYLTPVDYVALNIPTYPDIIKNPMDLKTMEEKLKQGKYRTADDLMTDFETMVQNSQIFNGPQHPVAQAGQSLRAYFIKCVSMMPKGEAAKATESKPKKSEPAAPKAPRPARQASTVTAKSPASEKPAGFLNEHGMPIIRRDSSAQNDRPKREIHPPKRDLPASSARPKKKKAQLELRFAETVVAELHKKKHQSFTYAFLYPVDPVALNIPNYLRIIKKPMDFGTILTNLKNGQYSSAKEVHADCKLVFANCYKFNPPTDAVFKMGKETEELFDKLWANKDQWIADNQPQSEPASEEEEEDVEEEEEEPEDPNIRRMQEIQAQIAALSAEAQQLIQPTRRMSPKVSTKSKSAKASSSKPKAASKSQTVSAPKSKPKKASKPKKLTLDQKREVSEGIANLDEAKMRKAVQIIRNGVPSLANVQDDELELDIDEIPEDVVYKLWEFVKASAPKREREPSPDYVDDDEDDTYQARSTGVGGPRRKNKPMKAQEQEERIKQLQEKLQGGGVSGSSASPIAQHHESEDEGDSESSEEE
ncbi:uncharacterized protein PV09_02713 [Verruconis gallopava]|uniref:Bromodomain-containing protein n=1 Tax=Verruconis gallopava TaxID=253628 RepID=A0A0D2B4S1_9PEZI|nr:uncharacterized protein PV09_02713 [Verruconis gallopava]KIW06239.1 hypothetical protein PV09_02713 [Verruconis gallopava]